MSRTEERVENTKLGKSQKMLGNQRKNKKRSSKKSHSKVDSWCGGEDQNEMKGSDMEYAPMFWQQSGIPSHIQTTHNGQRLFTAISDPSVCGYSTMPVAYTMEPVSMPPIYPLFRPVPQPNCRVYRGRLNKNIPQNPQMVIHSNENHVVNGYSSLQESQSNYSIPPLYQNGDYTSLPPGGINGNSGINPNNDEEINSEHRRYSDPGLGPADLPSYPNTEDSDSQDSDSSITTVGKNNKLILSLVEQITSLKETNTQIFKELQETKLAMENFKSELARVKCHNSLDYQPGMLSDIISEIRQANKVLDESIVAKANAIIEEKLQKKHLEYEEIKEQLDKILEEKAEGYKRIAKLEQEVANLKVKVNNEGLEIAAFEEETLALRRELQEARSSINRHSYNVEKLEKLVAILRKEINGSFDDSGSSSTPSNGILTSTPNNNFNTYRQDDNTSSFHDEDDDSSSSDDDDFHLNVHQSTSFNDQKSEMNINGPVTDL